MPKLTNAERCRLNYAKNREKRLAQKREQFIERHDEMIARQREQYAKHREKRVEYAREYRRRNQEKIAAKAMEKYRANRDAINARRKERLAEDPELKARKYAQIVRAKKANPVRQALDHAKHVLAEQTGLRFRDIPDELAEAKLLQLELHRLAKTAPITGE